MNLTIEVYISILSTLFTLLSGIIVLYQYLKFPDYALLNMALAWFSFTLFLLLTSLGYLFLNPRIFENKTYALVILVFFTQTTMNLLTSGRLINFRTVLIMFVSAFSISALFMDKSVERMEFANGDQSLRNIGLNRIFLVILFTYVVLNLLYYSFKIYWFSPKSLKRSSRTYLVGNLIIGILGLGSFATNLSSMIPGITELSISIGIFISSIGLIRAPQLLNVLPFQAIKLSIIESKSGINFYNYHWNQNVETISDELFASAIHAITLFVQEGLGSDLIKEVRLENNNILIHKPQGQDLFYVILATKTSYTLSQGLEKFAQIFYQNFVTEIHKDIKNLNDFTSADELIPITFPYVPRNIQV